jgi:hypothetical protein
MTYEYHSDHLFYVTFNTNLYFFRRPLFLQICTQDRLAMEVQLLLEPPSSLPQVLEELEAKRAVRGVMPGIAVGCT